MATVAAAVGDCDGDNDHACASIDVCKKSKRRKYDTHTHTQNFEATRRTNEQATTTHVNERHRALGAMLMRLQQLARNHVQKSLCVSKL
jgi:hypothetical protein